MTDDSSACVDGGSGGLGGPAGGLGVVVSALPTDAECTRGTAPLGAACWASLAPEALSPPVPFVGVGAHAAVLDSTVPNATAASVTRLPGGGGGFSRGAVRESSTLRCDGRTSADEDDNDEGRLAVTRAAADSVALAAASPLALGVFSGVTKDPGVSSDRALSGTIVDASDTA
jgi:hypothetical protein